MIGRPLKEYMHKTRAAIGEVALKVENLTLPGVFRDISFEVRKGEIVGLGGLVGAGRTDVARAIFGVAPAHSGTVTINGNAVIISEPSQAIDLGLAFVPEDRASAGIFRTLSVEENITAAIPKQIAPGGIIKRSLEKTLASNSVRKLRIRLASLRQPIGELSGGNQQKAILARWLLTDPSVLILDEPTRGIDIGVKAEFYDMIGELAASGPRHPSYLFRAAGASGPLRPRAGDVGRPADGEYPARGGDAGKHHACRGAALGAGGRGMNVVGNLLLRREAGILVMIVLFCAAVGVMRPRFLTLDELRIILLLVPLIMIGAMGQMLVIVARHVDLSIGSTLGFSAMVTAMMFKFHPEIPWPLGFARVHRRRGRTGSPERRSGDALSAAGHHRHAWNAQSLSRA